MFIVKYIDSQRKQKKNKRIVFKGGFMTSFSVITIATVEKLVDRFYNADHDVHELKIVLHMKEKKKTALRSFRINIYRIKLVALTE